MEKNLDVFIFPLLTNMCYKTTAQMKYDWHCNNSNSIDIVIIAVLIFHPNNEHSAWIFLNNF